MLSKLKHLSRIYTAPAQMHLSERLTLYSLIYSYQPNYCLEIGTANGGAASIICGAMDDRNHGQLVCVDPFPDIAPETWQQISHRTTLVKGYSPQVLSKANNTIDGEFEIVLIDGNHSYHDVVADIEGVLPFLAPNSYLLFHDAHYYGVHGAINEILVQNPYLADCGLVSKDSTVLEENNQQVTYAGLRLLKYSPPAKSPKNSLPTYNHKRLIIENLSSYEIAQLIPLRRIMMSIFFVIIPRGLISNPTIIQLRKTIKIILFKLLRRS